MSVIAKFRDAVRLAEDQKSIMILSDKLRDEILPHLGVRLEDRGKGVDSIWKFEDKEILLKEISAKI